MSESCVLRETRCEGDICLTSPSAGDRRQDALIARLRPCLTNLGDRLVCLTRPSTYSWSKVRSLEVFNVEVASNTQQTGLVWFDLSALLLEKEEGKMTATEDEALEEEPRVETLSLQEEQAEVTVDEGDGAAAAAAAAAALGQTSEEEGALRRVLRNPRVKQALLRWLHGAQAELGSAGGELVPPPEWLRRRARMVFRGRGGEAVAYAAHFIKHVCPAQVRRGRGGMQFDLPLSGWSVSSAKASADDVPPLPWLRPPPWTCSLAWTSASQRCGASRMRTRTPSPRNSRRRWEASSG